MRIEIPFGASVSRPAHAVWAALTSGNGINYLLGTHLGRMVGGPHPEPVVRRMREGERYVFQGGTLGEQFELVVVSFDAPRRFQLSGVACRADGDTHMTVEVEVSEGPRGSLVEVTSALEDSSILSSSMSQFFIVLIDLWDQRDADSTNLRRALEDAVPADAAARGSHDRGDSWTAVGTVGANALAAALVNQAGVGLPGLALLYWTENLIIGALTVAKIAVARRVPTPVGRILAAVLFLMVFLPFWEWQAEFVRSILGLVRYYERWQSDLWLSLGTAQVIARFARDAWLASPEFAALGVIALLRCASFAVDFLFGPERRRAHFGILVQEPALWLAVVQGGVILGIVIAAPMGDSAYGVWFIAGVKTILELGVRRVWRSSY